MATLTPMNIPTLTVADPTNPTQVELDSHTNELNAIINTYSQLTAIFNLTTPTIPNIGAAPANAAQWLAHVNVLAATRTSVILYQQMVLNEAQGKLQTQRSTIKVQQPEFDGKPENTRGFLAALSTYRGLRTGDFPDDQTFIAWSLACMKGPLVDPWKNALLYRRATMLAQGQALPQTLTDWDIFIQGFTAKFANSNEAENAGRALMNLKQLRLAREFSQEFDRLAEVASLTGQTFLIDQYRRSLKLRVQEKLLRTAFHDLHTLQHTSIEWDDALFAFAKQQRSSEQGRKPPPRPNPKPQTSEAVPMDLDYTKLSPDKTKKRREAGLCFRCGKKGHIGRNCPNSKARPPEKGPWRPTRIAAIERPLSPASLLNSSFQEKEGTIKDFPDD